MPGRVLRARWATAPGAPDQESVSVEPVETETWHEVRAVREGRPTSQMILRGYGADDRIVYGTGSVVGADQVETRARAILADPDVAYVHMRSATNNCFTLRIDRGQATRG